LGGANSQLKHKNKERDELLSIAYKLKDQWEKSQVDVKELKEELENARQHLNNMVNEYEGYVSSERLQREALERTLVRSQFELKKVQESLEEFKKFNDRQGEAYENLKKESEEWERRYMKLVNSVESGTLFRILRHEGVHWKSMFSKLAKLANDVIETIPTKLAAADTAMHPLNTPSEVIAFVEFCKTMIRDFKERMKKI
jgi:DNA repair exonuclease SbcCD ATPase subunit